MLCYHELFLVSIFWINVQKYKMFHKVIIDYGQCFFSPSILWWDKIGDHQHEDLTKFGYKKISMFFKIFIYLHFGYSLEHVGEIWEFKETTFQNLTDQGVYFWIIKIIFFKLQKCMKVCPKQTSIAVLLKF